jgi:hypothetical protein
VLNIEGIGSIGAYARTDIRNPFVCAILRRDRDSHPATIDSILSDQKKYQQLSKKYAQWETESRRIATLAGSEELPNLFADFCEVYTLRSSEFNIILVIDRVLARSTDSRVVEIEEKILREDA